MKLKAVIIGAAHMHALELFRHVQACPDMELAGAADTEPVEPSDLRSQKPYSRRWNLETLREAGALIFEDWRGMLEQAKPDLALVTTENALHPEVFRACAGHAGAVSIEKPLACSLADALDIARVSRESGAEVFVNWPIAWRHFLYQMKEVLDSGRMGPLIKVRHIAGHTGPLGVRAVHRGTGGLQAEEMTPQEKADMWWYRPQGGGGAYLDMCCYGAMAGVWFSGGPCLQAAAMTGNFAHPFGGVEDNGMMLLRFRDSVAVVEGTWTTPTAALPPGPELYCRDGVIACEMRDGAAAVRLTYLDGRVQYLAPPEPDPGQASLPAAFAEHRLRGRPMPSITTLGNNLRVMAVLDAGLASVRSGKSERVESVEEAAGWKG
ncbi:MAG TPA: Gfo/Idh/MocA family oxidoreductase [Candidatus Limnocylindria bacterium]|nr:Gfo/Idh/MocA family oxidoreductase [Candidatus Limnocylindria bacterium]